MDLPFRCVDDGFGAVSRRPPSCGSVPAVAERYGTAGTLGMVTPLGSVTVVAPTNSTRETHLLTHTQMTL